MSPIGLNILANLAGNCWNAIMAIAFIPIYIRLMGIEAYGLVGLYATLQALFGLLDMGLSTTLNRQMARYSANVTETQEARNLLRTLEILYWGVALLIGLVVVLLAPLISNHWVRAERLSPITVQQTITILGLAMALRWPLTIYSGGLMGLQRHVLRNGIDAGMATLRGVGAVVILETVSPTIEAFFGWQAAISILHTALAAFFLWRSLPATGVKARFRLESLLAVWRFAAGMSAITILSLLLTQLDKVILSRLLTLEMFGYYSLAAVVSSGLGVLVASVFITVFPGFSRLVALGNQEALTHTYHRSCQLMSVATLPLALMLALFAPEILLLWTGSSVTAETTRWLVTLLVASSALSGLVNLPYALQLAYGWTKLALYTNVAALVLMAPLTILMTVTYGAVGAAATSVALSAAYVVVDPVLMHRRFLRGEQWRWYSQDIVLPLAPALAIVGLGRWAVTGPLSAGLLVLTLTSVYIAALTASALAAPGIRPLVFSYVFRRKSLSASPMSCS